MLPEGSVQLGTSVGVIQSPYLNEIGVARRSGAASPGVRELRRVRRGHRVGLSAVPRCEAFELMGLQARDEFGNDFRSGLWLFGERNALSRPQR